MREKRPYNNNDNSYWFVVRIDIGTLHCCNNNNNNNNCTLMSDENYYERVYYDKKRFLSFLNYLPSIAHNDTCMHREREIRFNRNDCRKIN